MTFYARVYHEGITDLTPSTDVNQRLIAEVGMRRSSVGQDMEDVFTWVSAAANEGYDGTAEGGDELNNDEDMAALTFDQLGEFEVAARFSVDAGLSWTICDGDLGSSDGYQAEEASLVASSSHARLALSVWSARAKTSMSAPRTTEAASERGARTTNGCAHMTVACHEGDGQTCTDVDECADNNGGCDLNATCTNNVGAPATCNCDPGYDGDGRHALTSMSVLITTAGVISTPPAQTTWARLLTVTVTRL